MTMEHRPKMIAVVGRPDVSIARAMRAANSHCLDSTCSVADEPIRIERPEPITYVLDTGEIQKQESAKTRRVKKRSRSKYSPVEEDRKHSQNAEITRGDSR